MARCSKGKGLILLGVLLVIIDQVIKVLVKTNMTLGESIPVLGTGSSWCSWRTRAWPLAWPSAA